MRTTDNNCGVIFEKLHGDEAECIDDLRPIANKSLGDLATKNPGLLVFPHKLNKYNDDIHKSWMFSMSDEKLTTYNIMGFVGRNDTRLTIASRFAKNDSNDYFLHYMLQKVFSLDIVNFDIFTGNERLWDFYLYLFPSLLHAALKQGLYKAYIRIHHNDANVKGIIDVKRHILCNTPFAGKIAHNTREYSFDNSVTELIHHTIEYIKTHPFGNGILNASADILADVRLIISTTPSYNRNARQKVINANSKPLKSPYFTEYTLLQKICLCILRHNKLTFGKEKNKIYGLLFDGAWLWEEYLNTILKDKFEHPRNKTKEGGYPLFNETSYTIYPDFISNDKTIIADAKYKRLEYNNVEYGRDDYYQLIAYMYRFGAPKGFLLFPYSSDTEKLSSREFTIKSTKGRLIKLGLLIPQTSHTFSEFKDAMRESEQKFFLDILSVS
jgi:5-methylcytosine-specific restriction endonuclease McrBC regulatory subunit McrC